MDIREPNNLEVQVTWGNLDNSLKKTELLPLRVAVLSEFIPEECFSKDFSQGTHLINLDKNNFNQILTNFSPRLNLSVTNHLNSDNSELIIELVFTRLSDFQPDSLGKQVKSISQLITFHFLLNELKESKITLADFNSKLSATGISTNILNEIHHVLESQATPKMTNALGTNDNQSISDQKDKISNILELVDTEASKIGANKNELSREIISQTLDVILGNDATSIKINKKALVTFSSDIFQKMEKQINEILHHPKFQKLESTWRGLKFLVDRIDFRKSILLQILSVPKDKLLEAVYHQLMLPEYKEISDVPLSFMIVDFEFDKSVDDFEILKNLAKMSSAMQVPCLTNVSLAFFGINKGVEFASLPDFRLFFKQPDYFSWVAFRDAEESKNLVLTTPNFLLRYPYTNESGTKKEFPFTETILSESDLLWGNGAYALSSAIIRSYILNGWPIQFTGIESGGKIENLPLWRIPNASGRDIRIPLIAMMRESKQFELAAEGFTVLGFVINSNHAYIINAPTFYRAPIFDNPEKTKESAVQATLSYQLFSTRVAHYIRVLKKQITPGMAPEQLKEFFASKLRVIISTNEMKAGEDSIQIELAESDSQKYNIAMRIIPPFRIMGYQPSLLIGLEVYC